MLLDDLSTIHKFRAAVLLKSLKLEMLGMKNSKGSAYSQIKKSYNLSGSRQSVYDQLDKIIKEGQLT